MPVNPWEKYAATPAQAATPQPAPWEKYGGTTIDPAPFVGPPQTSPRQAAVDNPFPSPDEYAKTPLLNSMSDRLFGAHPLNDSLSVIGSHLKNLVAAPYHAFMDGPQNPEEAQIKGTDAISGPMNALGQFGLGAARMFVQPTRQALGDMVTQAKAGNFAGTNYDSQGNYQPSAISSAMDVLPVVGPLSRGIDNDAHKHGAIPALLGGAVDLGTPELGAKVLPAAATATGTLAKVAASTPESISLAASRLLMDGTPGELLQSGLKPGVKYGAGAGNLLEKALPDVLAADPSLQGVSGFASAADKARADSFHPYNDLISPYRKPSGAGPYRPSSIDGNPIADAQMESIPAMNAFEDRGTAIPVQNTTVKVSAGPDGGSMNLGAQTGGGTRGGIFADTAATADLYRKPLSVPLLDDIRGDANEKLNAFYDKAKGNRSAALSNPETARVKAVGDSTRTQLYPQLESDAGLPAGAVSDMQNKYGMLSEVSDIANHREPIVSRHDPVSLAGHIAGSHSGILSPVIDFLKQKALRDLVDPDAQVNSAIDRFRNPDTSLSPRPDIFSRSAYQLGDLLSPARRR